MKASIGIYWDSSRRTALRIGDVKGVTRYVVVQTQASLKASTLKTAAFEAGFKPIPNYPVAKAAQLYLRWAQDLGATAEVLDALAKVIPVSKQARATALQLAESLAAKPVPKSKTAAY